MPAKRAFNKYCKCKYCTYKAKMLKIAFVKVSEGYLYLN